MPTNNYSFPMPGQALHNIAAEAQKAISAEHLLQDCYRRMSSEATDPKVKAVLHDLLLMEEMNEVLLRSINQRVGV